MRNAQTVCGTTMDAASYGYYMGPCGNYARSVSLLRELKCRSQLINYSRRCEILLGPACLSFLLGSYGRYNFYN